MDGKGALPPPPPIPPDTVPTKAKKVPMHRPALAKNGQPISLLTNHFKVDFRQTNDSYFHYSVSYFSSSLLSSLQEDCCNSPYIR